MAGSYAETESMTDEEFQLHAMTALARELGPGGFARYILLNGKGKGDYTAERREWQKDLTLDQILADIAANRHPPAEAKLT